MSVTNWNNGYASKGVDTRLHHPDGTLRKDDDGNQLHKPSYIPTQPGFFGKEQSLCANIVTTLMSTMQAWDATEWFPAVSECFHNREITVVDIDWNELSTVLGNATAFSNFMLFPEGVSKCMAAWKKTYEGYYKLPNSTEPAQIEEEGSAGTASALPRILEKAKEMTTRYNVFGTAKETGACIKKMNNVVKMFSLFMACSYLAPYASRWKALYTIAGLTAATLTLRKDIIDYFEAKGDRFADLTSEKGAAFALHIDSVMRRDLKEPQLSDDFNKVVRFSEADLGVLRNRLNPGAPVLGDEEVEQGVNANTGEGVALLKRLEDLKSLKNNIRLANMTQNVCKIALATLTLASLYYGAAWKTMLLSHKLIVPGVLVPTLITAWFLSTVWNRRDARLTGSFEQQIATSAVI